MIEDFTIIDYRNLVSLWYNEFLPSYFDNKLGIVNNSQIAYVMTSSFESSKVESVRFLFKEIEKIGEQCSKLVVVQEPKPYLNPGMNKLMQFIDSSDENSITDDNKNKIRHLANRRYVAYSENIILPDNREIDLFFDDVFARMASKLNLPNIKFYQSSHATFNDICTIAMEVFPKSMFHAIGFKYGDYIKVDSTNDVLTKLANHIGIDLVDDSDSTASKFLELANVSVKEELLALV